MNTQELMSYADVAGNVRDDRMLTMADPTGRVDGQLPITHVAVIDDCVVIDLLGVEDAIWYDAPSFDEEVSVWAFLF